MPTTIGRRLSFWIEHIQQISYAEAARVIGTNGPSMSKWSNGKQLPSLENLAAIKRAFPTLNLHWLVLGEGDPQVDAGVDVGGIRIRLATAILDRRTDLGALVRVGEALANEPTTASLPAVRAALDAVSAAETVDRAQGQGRAHR